MPPRQPSVSRRLLHTASLHALVIGAAFAAAPQSASAQTWTGAVSDDYADGANWSGGVAPIPSAVVTIDTETNAPVVDIGDTVNGGSLSIGPSAPATLTVRGGGNLTTRSIVVGGSTFQTPNGRGTMLVTGAGTSVNYNARLSVAPDGGSRGVLVVENGASISGQAVAIGTGAGSVADVTVRGALLNFGAGTLTMGRPGNATGTFDARLSILDGGRVVGGGGFGNVVGGGSTLLVSGSGSLMDNATALSLSSATARIADGGGLRAPTLLFNGDTRLTLDRGTMNATAANNSAGLSLTDTARIDAVNSRIEVGSILGLSGNSSLTVSGSDSALLATRVVLNGNSVLNIGAADGAAAAAIGVADEAFSANTLSFDNGINSRLVINHTGRLILRSQLEAGNGSSGTVHRAGTTILTTTDGGFRGRFDLTGGTVILDGLLSTDLLRVSGGAVLAGTGRLDRTATILDGIVRPGSEGAGVGILSLGALVLSPTSILDFQLGAPNAAAGAGNDLIRVSATNTAGNSTSTGNLTLDGTLNVTDVGGFGAGLYRLIDYTGALTDNGLIIGATPTGFAAGTLTVQTSVARQVNLIVGAPLGSISATFWDGADTGGNGVVNGGAGTWSTTGTNWTIADGTRNGAYDPTKLLLFAGTGGTVTVDSGAGAIAASGGLQFAGNGYRVEGGPIGFADGIATIRVGDGSAGGAAFTATVGSALTGATGLVKNDLGTLALIGASTIRGRTDVQNGTLAVETGGILSVDEVRIGANGPATLTVRGGGSLTAASTTVGGSLDGGSNASANGTLQIAGAGTQVSAGRLLAAFGDGSVGSISVTGGGVLNSASGEIGNRTSTGIATVSGAGSQWNSAGLARLGTGTTNNSRGSLTIVDGGVLTLAANSALQVSDGSDLRVSGVDSRIDGATTSTLSLERSTTGGTVVVENGGVVSVGSAEFGNTSALTIRSGARLEVAGSSTNFNQNARVLVTGAGSRLTTGGNFNFLANGVGTDIVFEDDAIVTSTANVGSSLAFRGSRRLIVRNGAEFNLTGGTAASFTLDGGTLDVTDASISLSGDLLFSDTSAISTAIFRNSDFSANNVALLGANARLIVGAEAGQAAGSVGNIDLGDRISITQPSAALVLNYDGPGLTIETRFDGTGGRFTHLAGETRLTGFSNQWRGITDLSGGSLAVDNLFGDSSGPTTAMNVSGGAILSGGGTIGGVVTVTDGTVRPGGDALPSPEAAPQAARLSAAAALPGGDAIGTLTFTGSLGLGAASRLEYQLGEPTGVAGVDGDLVNVGGNLTLDGTLNVTDVGGFGAGVYRLINYGGALTDNGLGIGAVPTGFGATDLAVQTSVANQVNLIVAAPPASTSFPFWDGSATVADGMIAGGSGTWTATDTNWTTTAATANGAFNPEDLLIFTGPTAGGQAQTLNRVTTQVVAAVSSAGAGTVTVDDSAGTIALETGMQFAVTGYTLTGDAIVLAATEPCGECSPLPGQTIVRVGDGTDTGTGFVTTIRSRLVGESGLLKTDRGTLILTGANTYSGGTEIAGGTLQGDATSLQGDIVIGSVGTLLFTQADDGEFAGALSGTGIFAKQGAAKLRLSADSSAFDGVSVVTGGELAVDGTLGSAVSAMQVGGAATLSGAGRIGGSVAVDDAIVSPGGIIDTPSVSARVATASARAASPVGLLTIDGNVSLTSTAILAFQLGDHSGEAGVTSDLIDVGGNLMLDGTLDVTDVGGFGVGLYRLINYGGTLTDNGLAIGATPDGFVPADLTVQTATAQQVNLLVGSPARSFAFWDGGDATGNGAVGGGSGTWSAAGTNWTLADGSRNGVYDPAALLIFGGSAGVVTTSGDIALGAGAQFAVDGYRVTGGAVRLDGVTTTFRVGDGTAAGAAYVATIDAALGGAGGLDKTDLGTLVLTGANSYAGGTTVTGGTLRGSTASLSGAMTIATSGTLQFDQSADGGFGGVLAGSGALRKTGGGTLSITGASTAFAGTTRVETGMLAVTGTLGGNVVVQAPATLTGTGRVGALDVSGRVAPSGIGTLSVTGDVTFRAGSIYAVDLAAAGGGDRIAVGGRATLSGGTVAVTTLDRDTDYRDGTIYRILDAAGGLTGTFAGLTETSAFLDFTLGYDATGASLRIAQVRTFPDVARTFNQIQAAGALKVLDRTPGTDALAVYNALLMLDADGARRAFDAASGEIYASVLGARQRHGLGLAGQFALRGTAGLAEGLGMWGGVTGHTGHVAGDGNGARIDADGVGGEVGIDYRGAANGWALGVGGGWQSGGVDVPARAAHAETDSWHLGGYLRYGTGAAGFTAVATAVLARTDVDVTRTIAFGTIARTARAESDVRTTAASLDLRYGIAAGRVSFGPTIGVDHASSNLGAFGESGAGALALSAGRNGDDWTRYGAGLFARFTGGAGYADLSARFVGGDRNGASADLVMTGSPQPFTVRAARGAGSGVHLQGSVGYDLGDRWSLTGQARAIGGDGDADIGGNIRIAYRF